MATRRGAHEAAEAAAVHKKDYIKTKIFLKKWFPRLLVFGGVAQGTSWLGERYFLNTVEDAPGASDFIKSKIVYRKNCDKFLGYEVVVKDHWLKPTHEQLGLSLAESEVDKAYNQTYWAQIRKYIWEWAVFMSTWEGEDGGRTKARKMIQENNKGIDDFNPILMMGDSSDKKEEQVLQKIGHGGDHVVGGDASLTAASSSSSPSSGLEDEMGTRYASVTIRPITSKESGGGGFSSMIDSLTHQSLQKCDDNVAPMVVSTTSASLNSATGGGDNDKFNPCIPDNSVLLAPYLRVMLGAMGLLKLPLETNMSVAALGVAGGTLPMFLQQHFSQFITDLTLVDAEPVVFEAATKKLGLRSLSDIKTRYVAEDALEFLRKNNLGTSVREEINKQQHSANTKDNKSSTGISSDGRSSAVPTVSVTSNKFDMVFLDCFVGSTIPDHLLSMEAMVALRSSLKSTGVAALNLPSRDRRVLMDMEQVFGRDNIFHCQVPSQPNYVVIVCKNLPSTYISNRHIVDRLKVLSGAYRLPFDLGNELPFYWSFW